MVTDQNGDFTGETEDVAEHQLRRWQNMPLTDQQYVGGDGTPFCLDNNVLLNAPWRLSNVAYDRSLAFAGKRRYRPVLVYFIAVRKPRSFFVPEISKQGEPTWARERGRDGEPGEFRMTRDGQAVAKGEPVFLGWSTQLLPVGSAPFSAEVSARYQRVVDAWNREQKFPDDLTASEREVVDTLKKGTDEIKSNLPQKHREETRVVVERRWYPDRNHPEHYQQYVRRMHGRVPSYKFFALYNRIRKTARYNPNHLVEDPYVGEMGHLLDGGEPKGLIKVGNLDEYGWLSLAEIISARWTHSFGYVWESEQDMRARALVRGCTDHPLNGVDGERSVLDFYEEESYWMVPSCQTEFLKVTAAGLRTDLVKSALPSELRRGNVKDRTFRDLLNADIINPTSVAVIADKVCAAVNRYSLIVKPPRIREDGSVDESQAHTAYLSVEDERDTTRDNEKAIRDRSDESTYEAGGMDEAAVKRSQDRGVGGRRSRRLAWSDPKTRLLWSLTHRMVWELGPDGRRHPKKDRFGCTIWEPRYRDPKVVRRDQRILREAARIKVQALRDHEADPKIPVPTNEQCKFAAWEARTRQLMNVAMYLQDPKSDYFPADQTVWATNNGRKASITGGVMTKRTATTKARGGDGYQRKEMDDDLPKVREYPPSGYDGPLTPELYVAMLELAAYMDFRDVAKNQKLYWSWYLESELSLRTRAVHRSIEATRENFLHMQTMLHRIWDLQHASVIEEQLRFVWEREKRKRTIHIRPVLYREVWDHHSSDTLERMRPLLERYNKLSDRRVRLWAMFASHGKTGGIRGWPISTAVQYCLDGYGTNNGLPKSKWQGRQADLIMIAWIGDQFEQAVRLTRGITYYIVNEVDPMKKHELVARKMDSGLHPKFAKRVAEVLTTESLYKWDLLIPEDTPKQVTFVEAIFTQYEIKYLGDDILAEITRGEMHVSLEQAA